MNGERKYNGTNGTWCILTSQESQKTVKIIFFSSQLLSLSLYYPGKTRCHHCLSIFGRSRNNDAILTNSTKCKTLQPRLCQNLNFLNYFCENLSKQKSFSQRWASRRVRWCNADKGMTSSTVISITRMSDEVKKHKVESEKFAESGEMSRVVVRLWRDCNLILLHERRHLTFSAVLKRGFFTQNRVKEL